MFLLLRLLWAFYPIKDAYTSRKPSLVQEKAGAISTGRWYEQRVLNHHGHMLAVWLAAGGEAAGGQTAQLCRVSTRAERWTDRQTDSCEGGGLKGRPKVMTCKSLSKPLPTRCFLCSRLAEGGQRVPSSEPTPQDSPELFIQTGEQWHHSPEMRLSRAGSGKAAMGLKAGTPADPPHSQGGRTGLWMRHLPAEERLEASSEPPHYQTKAKAARAHDRHLLWGRLQLFGVVSDHLLWLWLWGPS